MFQVLLKKTKEKLASQMGKLNIIYSEIKHLKQECEKLERAQNCFLDALKIIQIQEDKFVVEKISAINQKILNSVPLTLEDDLFLGKRILLFGDQRARECLILAYRYLVSYIARRRFRFSTNEAGLEYVDYVSLGTIGLIDAVDKFDYRKGYMFKTYAEFRIRGAIDDELREHGHIIPKPQSQKDKENIITIFFSECGEPEKEIIDFLYRDWKNPESLFLAKEKFEHNIKRFKLIGNVLSPRQREILFETYGLNDSFIPKPQIQIARELGLEESTISSHLNRAFKSLKKKNAISMTREEFFLLVEETRNIKEVLDSFD